MRRCVYTALTGGYESLNEQPVAKASGLPFICFTDNPDIVSETWQIRPLNPIFPADAIRSQREYKLLPHKFLPEFDASLYIDNSVLLTVPPEQVFEKIPYPSGISLPAHSFRASVEDEFLEVAKDRLDDPARIAEQLDHYRANWPDVLAQKPFWNGILLRDHHNPVVIAAMETWRAHNYRYSRRDQLSAPVAFAQAGLIPDVMVINNFKSWFHSWPHAPDRKAGRRLWPAVDVYAAHNRWLAVEHDRAAVQRQLTALTLEHQAVLNSTSWRLTAFLRWLAAKFR